MRAPGKDRSLEARVGLFVVLGFMVIALYSFRLTESPIFQRGMEVTTYLDDATGLFKLTKIKLAGIPIGFVKDIELDGHRAKVIMVIEPGYELPRGARVIPRPLGILGDKFLEIQIPPPPGAASSPPPAEIVPEKKEAPKARTERRRRSRGAWLRRLENWIYPSARAQSSSAPAQSPAAAAAKPAAKPVGRIKSGDVIPSATSGASVDDLTRDAADISKDVKATSTSVRTLVENNAPEIESLIRSLNRMVTKLEKTLNRIDSEKMAKDIEALSQAAGKMSRTLEHTESITEKIDRGEGTLGKLVNDATTVNELNRSLSHLNHAIERSRRIQTIVDLNGDYRTAMSSTKTHVGMSIFTRETSGYIAEVVVDPAGTQKKVVTTVQKDGGPVETTETITNDRTKLKFSVQFYKRIGDTAFRLGLFENTGGLAMDVFVWRERLRLSVETFGIGREGDNPYLRAFVRVPFWNYLYAQAGGDDIITKMRSSDFKPSFFAGLGVRFTDDDLKTLFLLPGIP